VSQYELFKSLHTEEEYSKFCLENYPKYKNYISKMSINELKQMVFSEEFPINNFEGIATIITALNQKDLNKLIKYIYSISLEPPNIIRILMTTLDNVSYYEGKFMYELIKFKSTYEVKLKKLLFDLGTLPYIDKLDLINMFKKLVN
jgi:hypothetical protein